MAEGPRLEKLENLLKNHSIIVNGVFEEDLAVLAERISEEGGEDIAPELKIELESMISEIREDVDSQWTKDAKLFEKYASGPAFDEGIRIVEARDFHRPSITEKLGDLPLASYIFLLQSGDQALRGMFAELDEWRRSLPRPPWQS